MLSFTKKRLSFLGQMISENPIHNIPMALAVKGHLNIPSLRKAIEEIERRHESIRMRFELIESETVQFIEEDDPVQDCNIAL